MSQKLHRLPMHIKLSPLVNALEQKRVLWCLMAIAQSQAKRSLN